LSAFQLARRRIASASAGVTRARRVVRNSRTAARAASFSCMRSRVCPAHVPEGVPVQGGEQRRRRGGRLLPVRRCHRHRAAVPAFREGLARQGRIPRPGPGPAGLPRCFFDHAALHDRRRRPRRGVHRHPGRHDGGADPLHRTIHRQRRQDHRESAVLPQRRRPGRQAHSRLSHGIRTMDRVGHVRAECGQPGPGR
jgi:hypothetical protein